MSLLNASLAVLLVTTSPGAAGPTTVTLKPLGASHERGTATIDRQGGKLIVVVRVTGLPADAPPQLVHMHRDACAAPSSTRAVHLRPLVRGVSRSVVGAPGTPGGIAAGTYYVSVHKVLAETSSHVACGGPVRIR